MVISCSTFVVIGLIVSFCSLKGLLRIAGMVLILAFGAGVLIIWHDSLYSGDNLETEYSWAYTPPQYPPNIAYGKKLSGFFSSDGSLIHHGSKMVDGETQPGSGVTFKPADDRALIVDLHQKSKIKTIVIFGNMDSQPLISFSKEGNKWNNIAYLAEKKYQNNVLRIDLRKTQLARFVKIKPLESNLEIDEIEIY
jgi:hypothetical protein